MLNKSKKEQGRGGNWQEKYSQFEYEGFVQTQFVWKGAPRVVRASLHLLLINTENGGGGREARRERAPRLSMKRARKRAIAAALKRWVRR